jgi:protein-S-isoprenylcysteine O-methyltransferase Ste14
MSPGHDLSPEGSSTPRKAPQTVFITRYAVRESMGIIVMAVALFWSAGRVDWWPAWAAIAVMASWIIATAIVILRFNKDLLAERLGPRKGAKPWDTTLMSILGMTQLIRYVVAGFDRRFNWTQEFPVSVQIVSLVLCFLGYSLFLWATASNSFFSQIVRIQSERGHAVARTGPYKHVRHPSYAGAIVYELAVAVLLTSWWALLVGAVNAALLILRTHLEDRTLQVELPGYQEYSREVHHRLIPGIW